MNVPLSALIASFPKREGRGIKVMANEIDPELRAAAFAFVRSWVGEGKDRFAELLLNDEHSNFASMLACSTPRTGGILLSRTVMDGLSLRLIRRRRTA